MSFGMSPKATTSAAVSPSRSHNQASPAAFVTPAASTRFQVSSTEFAVPTAGYYALGIVNSLSTANNSFVGAMARVTARTP